MNRTPTKKRNYVGIPPTAPPLPPPAKKSKETLEFEEKYERRLNKLYKKMEEEQEERNREVEAEKFDRYMEWAVRGTGKKYEPVSKKWKTAVAQSKRKGGKKTRKNKKTRTRRKYRK